MNKVILQICMFVRECVLLAAALVKRLRKLGFCGLLPIIRLCFRPLVAVLVVPPIRVGFHCQLTVHQ